MEAFLRLEMVSEHIPSSLFLRKFGHCTLTSTFISFVRLDYALVGHIMSTAVVVDEFECQLKCLENESCKSINVHTDIHICELNNITRQMKPGDFKWKKGSKYYGTVKVNKLLV